MIVRVTGHGNEGLKLFVESSGTKSWYFRAHVNGSPPKDMPFGRWPGISIAEAHRRKADAVSAIAKSEDSWLGRAEDKRRRHGITLDQVFEQWAAEVGYVKRTIEQDRLRYRMPLQGSSCDPAQSARARRQDA